MAPEVLPQLPTGWTWYTDDRLGFAAPVASEWTALRRGEACPLFDTNPAAGSGFLDLTKFRTTDEVFNVCTSPTVGSPITPHDNGSYTAVLVSGIATYESELIATAAQGGYHQYSVVISGNGLTYELHATFMSAVSQARTTKVRSLLWSNFTIFQPVGPLPSATAREIEIVFVLSVAGTVPAGTGLGLTFNYPTAGQTGFSFCDGSVDRPCNAPGHVLRLDFTGLRAMDGVATYQYEVVRGGQVVREFANGSVDLSKSGTVTASISFP